MYELIQVKNNSYYIESPAKIGLCKISENEVILIDSGNDKSAGRKVRQVLDENNWTLKAIYCTHSHADHIGGCQYLQSQKQCKVYAPGIECSFTRFPILEPAFLYGGFPPQQIQNKFLKAQESDAEFLTEEVLPEGFRLIPLPGHSYDMVGIVSADGVAYIADSVSSKETIEKYGISYLYNPGQYMESLEALKNVEADVFVPAHAAVTNDICDLADFNLVKAQEVADNIYKLCAEPACFEELLKRVFDLYGATLNFDQYVLIGSTVRSYLTYLKEAGRVDCTFEENRMTWKQVSQPTE